MEPVAKSNSCQLGDEPKHCYRQEKPSPPFTAHLSVNKILLVWCIWCYWNIYANSWGAAIVFFLFPTVASLRWSSHRKARSSRSLLGGFWLVWTSRPGLNKSVPDECWYLKSNSRLSLSSSGAQTVTLARKWLTLRLAAVWRRLLGRLLEIWADAASRFLRLIAFSVAVQQEAVTLPQLCQIPYVYQTCNL